MRGEQIYLLAPNPIGPFTSQIIHIVVYSWLGGLKKLFIRIHLFVLLGVEIVDKFGWVASH